MNYEAGFISYHNEDKQGLISFRKTRLHNAAWKRK